MKKFRYMVFTEELPENTDDFVLYKYFDNNNISYGDPSDDRTSRDIYMSSKINTLGNNGWELVSVIEKKDKTIFYFKKEVE